MNVFPILTEPDPFLRRVCDPVVQFDGALGQLAQDMFSTLYKAGGRGLAAPQIARGDRIFIMDAGWKEGAPRPMVFVNPAVTDAAPETEVAEERCLSIPDTPCPVDRPVWVDLRWQRLDGTWTHARFDGFQGRCVQHELDHLDGILCTDRAPG